MRTCLSAIAPFYFRTVGPHYRGGTALAYGSTTLRAITLAACAAVVLVLTACTAKAGQGTTKQTVKVGQESRTYYLHVPPRLPEDKPAALVLMFHGGGGTPAFAERESRFSELADREGFLVAYPEGIGRSWNDGRDIRTESAQRKSDDVGFVAALIDDVAQDHRIDAKRVFATGISNGAMFSHCLAMNLSPRIAAIAPVAGGLAESSRERFHPEMPVSVLILHSTGDPLVPYHGGDIVLPGGFKRAGIIDTDETVRKWVDHDGCRREPVVEDLPDSDPADGSRVRKFTYPKGKDGTEVVLYRIEGGGHTWPGGLQYLPAKLIGRVCRDIDGTRVIWDFFKTHPKP